MSRIIHVIGTGTIGEPLTGLLTYFSDKLEIDEVTFHKNTPYKTDRPKVLDLMKRGAKLAVDYSKRSQFEEMGMIPLLGSDEAIERATVVIDCTPVGNKNKEKYERFSGPNGFIAQGSEQGFGVPYARGINDSALNGARYIQVVSCNTHNIASIINSLALQNGQSPENLVTGDFVCMRRATDVSQVKGHLPSIEVGSHDSKFGTHHAEDAYRLFSTLGKNYGLTSSAVKLPTQYMHTIRFNLEVANRPYLPGLVDLIKENEWQALTYKKCANEVFSFGRDHGFFGRILNQTVIPHETLHVSGNNIRGFCFTPQDGNSLLSSVAAAMRLVDPETYEAKIQCLEPYFFDEI